MEASYHSWLQCAIITNDNKGSQVRNTKYIVEGVVLYKGLKWVHCKGLLKLILEQALSNCEFCLSRILLYFHMFSQLVSHRRDVSTFVNNLMVWTTLTTLITFTPFTTDWSRIYKEMIIVFALFTWSSVSSCHFSFFLIYLPNLDREHWSCDTCACSAVKK